MRHDDRPIPATVATGPNRPYRQCRLRRQQRTPRRPFARSHTPGHQHRLLRRISCCQCQQCRTSSTASLRTLPRLRLGPTPTGGCATAFATRSLGRRLFSLTHHAQSLANHFMNLKIRSRNCGLRPKSDPDRRRCELLDRCSQGRTERSESHDCGRPANLPQYHPDRKPVISQQAAPSPTRGEKIATFGASGNAPPTNGGSTE